MQENADATQTLTCALDPARAQALQATLGETPSIDSGDTLPPFAHHIYFWDPQTPYNLGEDGHPATGGFIPDFGLPRRMWAAGRLVQHQPLKAGIKAIKSSKVEAVTRKQGKTGDLAFVHGPLLAHLMMQMATQLHGPFNAFSYRGASPLLAHETATLCAKDGQFWVRAADGRLCTSGQIETG